MQDMSTVNRTIAPENSTFTVYSVAVEKAAHNEMCTILHEGLLLTNKQESPSEFPSNLISIYQETHLI